MRRSIFSHRLGGLLLAATCATGGTLAGPLAPYNVDPSEVTVSGISSGGAMAVQAHVAYSGTFRGAAVFAGMPFYCAYGNVAIGMGTCAQAVTAAEVNVPDLVRITREWASRGWVDDPANLANDKVYLFSGRLDQTVRPGAVEALRDYYLNFVPAANITYNHGLDAGHGWISLLGPVACPLQQSPFINNCQIDPQETFLTMFYGGLAPRRTGALSGTFLPVDQAEFLDDGNPAAHSLDANGWLYVPEACRRGEACRLHVAYHGCSMTYNRIGDAFIRGSGLNEWADTNRIIVLYPQAVPTQPGNGLGCWDWYAYDSPDYAKKNGPQMLMSKRMVDRVTSGHAPVSAPTDVSATALGSSGVRVVWSPAEGATAYRVYRDGAEVTSNITTALSYTDRTVGSGATYVYTVRAMAANGNMGPPSNGAAATPR